MTAIWLASFRCSVHRSRRRDGRAYRPRHIYRSLASRLGVELRIGCFDMM